MALTNAERQARWRQRREAWIEELLRAATKATPAPVLLVLPVAQPAPLPEPPAPKRQRRRRPGREIGAG